MAAGRRVLLVEAYAHSALGHFSVMFAELATALTDLGAEVVVLTSTGWLRNGSEHSFEVHMAGRFTRLLQRWGRYGNANPSTGTSRSNRSFKGAVRAAGRTLRDIGMARATRSLCRRVGATDVIVTTMTPDPHAFIAAAGPGRFLMYQFGAPTRATSVTRRWLMSVSRMADRRRVRRGGVTRIAVNDINNLEPWRQVTPWLEPIRLPFAAARVRTEIPDARQALQFDPEARIALLFGTPHLQKDYDVVWDAFSQLPEWHLVAAGTGVQESYRTWEQRAGSAAVQPTIIDGFVDERTRDLLHSASDLLVLSFRPNTHHDSGTLADAIAWGRPVVCSREGFAGDTVERLGLGPTFENGDTMSLIEAVAAAPRSLDPATIQRAQHEFSSAAMAEQHLAALDPRS